MLKPLINLVYATLLSTGALAALLSGRDEPAWTFVQNGTTGIVGLELMVVSPTLAIMFNKGTNDPLQINNHTAWGALWSFETNTVIPVDLRTNTFCASGGFLSNGTMISVGGTRVQNETDNVPDGEGYTSIRVFEPCLTPDGEGCTILDDPSLMHMAVPRWYPTALRIPDGSLMIIGGTTNSTPFFNELPDDSFEFFPSKDGGVVRPSAFLERSLPANLFPRALALPDGKIFMVANNQTIIYDIDTNEETILPDIPNGVRVTNPYDGTATLLPLSPPDYIPEVLVCGGNNATETVDSFKLSTQDPASAQCSRITVTPEGIEKGWELDSMLEGRMMPEMLLMPNGKVLIINGAGTGYAAIASVGDLVVDDSNADHPVLTPSLYTPSAPLGERFSNAGMPTSDIPRMYHSGVTLTPMGNFLVTGSNPNNLNVNDTVFPSELRAEYLNPPYMFMDRPVIRDGPKQIGFNETFQLSIDIPSNLDVTKMQVALIDLGFSTHAFHSSSRLVFMDAVLSADKGTLSISAPPNNRIYPPGPGWVFVTVDDVSSEGAPVMVGSGGAPPLDDEGVFF